MFSSGVTVTVRRFTLDRYGDRTLEDSHQVDDCALSPLTIREGIASKEFHQQQAQVESTQVLYAPYGSDVTAHDVVVVPSGDEYEVDGQPESWTSPFTGNIQGMVVYLKRVTG